MKRTITFTNHAVSKIALLKRHGFIINKKHIVETVSHPDNLDIISDEPNIIASKDFDSQHILRVVYKIDADIIKIITFYPAEKGRYY